MRVHTVGHGTRPLEELVRVLVGAGVETLVDVRRFAGSRRNPQFNVDPLRDALVDARITYAHAPELGGRRANEPVEAAALPSPCFMCAETLWTRCHRRLIAELLNARGVEVVHLLAPGRAEPHVRWDVADARDGRLYLCGELVA